jgi:hypothetical protein
MGIQMRKKIVIACDKYKGNLSALEVCNIIKEAIIETGGYTYRKLQGNEDPNPGNRSSG